MMTGLDYHISHGVVFKHVKRYKGLPSKLVGQVCGKHFSPRNESNLLLRLSVVTYYSRLLTYNF